jgi:type II secretory pathway component PulK
VLRAQRIPGMFDAGRPLRSRSEQRQGYVLLVVLLVVVVLSLVAYQYQDAMSSELQASARAADAVQARANAISGIHYAAGVIADPNNANTVLANNSELFANQSVGDASGPRGGSRFSLINIVNTGSGTYERQYGMQDESAKINVNMLIQLDPQGNTLHDVLMKLPNMTEEIADAIVDWVDTDSSTRPAGCEAEYYSGLTPPYKCKNGPINSLEELLLVRGVTPDLLFGTDRNRNGVQDPSETELGEFGRGWSEYLTCYGREINIDSNGGPRINLNGTDAKALSEQLTSVLGQDLSDYIVYYRFTGTGEPAGLGLGVNKVEVSQADANLRGLVQARIDSGALLTRRLTSTLTVFNTQIPLSALPSEPGKPPNPARAVPCPVNTPEALKKVIGVLLDKCTASDDFEMVPRINLFTAPREVIACLPGLSPTDVDSILSNRPSTNTEQSSAWLVSSANLNPTVFKNIERYVTGRSGAYRVQSVGYFGKPGGATARVEAVIEMVQGRPRIVYFRDLTELGRGFDDLPR